MERLRVELCVFLWLRHIYFFCKAVVYKAKASLVREHRSGNYIGA